MIRFALLASLCAGAPCITFAQTADDLGKSLTPFGAIRAGNPAGTIPAWTGGSVRAPAGYQAGQPKPDPFGSEKPLFTITPENFLKYEQNLSAGTVAKLNTLPGYYINVYPTHRDFNAPDYILNAAIQNGHKARLAPNGVDVVNAVESVPFPIPHNGNEAILNHVLRFRGSAVQRRYVTAVISPTGAYSLEHRNEEIIFPYNQKGARSERRDSLFFQNVIGPPRIAGALTLVKNYTDPAEEPREAWTYNTGERRVRRAPEIAYDTPINNSDGLETTDDFDLFNGSIDRYDWKLVGRQEIYVPYNSYKLGNTNLRYSDLLRKEFIDPGYERWELHRVWVIDARLKPNQRHIYSRRTVYLDEDSWQMLISDRYDGRGELWRAAVAFPILAYEVPVVIADSYEYIDLRAHRYIASILHNEEPVQPIYNATGLDPSEFTADVLRRKGIR